jgi:hypothetical protein
LDELAVSGRTGPTRPVWRVKKPLPTVQASERKIMRVYHSRRTGKTKGIDLPKLCDALQCTYTDFASRQYFDEAFGKQCEEQGYLPGSAGPDIDGYFLRILGTRGLWPITEKYKNYTEDTAFDVVELLFDLVSKPKEGYFHNYGGCGWHYSTFDQPAGRSEFRNAINDFLGSYGDGYELSPAGEVRSLLSPQLSILISNELPKYDTEHVTLPVEHAIALYRKRGASPEDTKSAIVKLAGVLEFLRPRMRDILDKEDDKAMFNLANNFDLRHHNDAQRTDYDPIWLNWDFYLFLSTIHVVVRLLIKAEHASSGTAGTPSADH